MIDSELKELRKIKIKRILLWTCGITVVATIITIFVIYSLLNTGES